MINRYLTDKDIKYELSNLKQVTFEVTDACNLSCKYCAYGEFYNDFDNRENKMMSFSSAVKVIDYLNEFWNSPQNMSSHKNVYISFYGGEPLLNMPFVKSLVTYIKNIKCCNRSFTFSMTTNALLLHKYMDFLVENDFSLLISLDGNEYNTSYRVNLTGMPVFNEIIKNVDLIQNNYPDYFIRKVNFNAVLHNRNTVADIYNFFKTKYNKIPSIGELNNMGIQLNKLELFKKTYRNKYESLLQAENYEKIEQDMFIKTGTYQTLTAFIHQYSGFVFNRYTDLIIDKPKRILPTGTCLPFSRRMFVTVNGKIMPCERIGHQFSLGKVSDEDGVKLDFERIADIYNTYFNKLDKQCSKCYKRNSCTQCIFNLNDLNGNAICQGFTGEKAFNGYVKNQLDYLRTNPEAYYRIMEEVITE